VDKEEDHQPTDLPGFFFDKEYFEQVEAEDTYDEGSMARFRMVNGDKSKYLHLYNLHNGYYSHGFEVKHGGTVVKSGSL